MHPDLKHWLAVIVIVSSVGAALAVNHQNLGQLRTDKTDGAAPLTVTVDGPKELADQLTRWQRNGGQHQRLGDGFSLQWGDGSGGGDAAKSPVGADALNPIGQHTYGKPGTYALSASLYDILPTGTHQTYWRGTAIINAK